MTWAQINLKCDCDYVSPHVVFAGKSLESNCKLSADDLYLGWVVVMVVLSCHGQSPLESGPPRLSTAE